MEEEQLKLSVTRCKQKSAINLKRGACFWTLRINEEYSFSHHRWEKSKVLFLKSKKTRIAKVQNN